MKVTLSTSFFERRARTWRDEGYKDTVRLAALFPPSNYTLSGGKGYRSTAGYCSSALASKPGAG